MPCDPSILRQVPLFALLDDEETCVLAGQVGISGSTKLGDFVMVGGKAGLAGHLNIGSGARIAGKSGVMRDIAAGVQFLRRFL